MRIPKRYFIAFAILIMISLLLPAQVQDSTRLTKEQMRQFLLTAKVLKSKEIGKGVTRPVKLTLTDGVSTHDALFQSIEDRRTSAEFVGGGGELYFADSFHFNIAAYHIAELLGIDNMIPVTVEREWRRQRGSLSWWIEAKLDAAERAEKAIPPPDTHAWNLQMSKVRVFTQLVYDTDRNFTNVLITDDWKVWMIDFTRAFRPWNKLEDEKELVKCDRELLAKLRLLSRADVERAVGQHLTKWEIDGLMARAQLIVAQFEKLISEKGEAQVLY